jgi:hypothetical protein
MAWAPGNNIRIEYDRQAECYQIIWAPMVVVGAGGTRTEALEDLRRAAHFGVDAMVDVKLAKLGRKAR